MTASLPFAQDQVCAALLILGNVVFDRGRNHFALPFAHVLHVDRVSSGFNSEFCAASKQRRHCGAMDDVFAREACDVVTGASAPEALSRVG